MHCAVPKPLKERWEKNEQEVSNPANLRPIIPTRLTTGPEAVRVYAREILSKDDYVYA